MVIRLAMVVSILMLVAPVRAQVTVVGDRGAVMFAPQIDTVESGTLLDTQATVSADRKYVTLTMRPQISNVIAIQIFNFQNATTQGFVGAARGRAPAPAFDGGIARGPVVPLPTVRPVSILEQPGTHRLGD